MNSKSTNPRALTLMSHGVDSATRSFKIAIQGSGISGSTVAERLIRLSNNDKSENESQRRGQPKYEVTVFESGRGPGGRMSTRRTGDKYRWDHGAQYFSPKTEAFANVVNNDWKKKGWCDVWNGRHCVWTREHSSVIIDPNSMHRYVGTPGMNAICKGMLEDVNTVYGTRAVAKPTVDRSRNDAPGWTIRNGKTGEHLGEYDFLICTDKTSAMQYRNDIDIYNPKGKDKKDGGGSSSSSSSSVMDDFIRPARRIRSNRGLALMLAFTTTSDGQFFDFDSLTLDGHPHFSWLSRDDSKPGRRMGSGEGDRGVDNNIQCWVAHASPKFIEEFFESHKGRIRHAAAARQAIINKLVPKFEDLMRDLGGGGSNDTNGTEAVIAELSPVKILMVQGHRWGAAVPVSSFSGGNGSVGKPFHLDVGSAFAACGDYFGPHPGQVEGGWISGLNLADALHREL